MSFGMSSAPELLSPCAALAAGLETVLPPRLAHLYVARSHRRRGIGTGMITWWKKKFAVPVQVFAVDTPSAAMERLLAKVGRCRLTLSNPS